MKSRIEQSELANAMKIVMPAVGKGGDIIARGVCIDVSGDDTSFTCTNLELTICTQTSGGLDEGRSVVTADRLAKISAVMKPGAITLSSNDGMLTVSGGGSEFILQEMDATMWPNVRVGERGELELNEQQIRDLSRILPYTARHDVEASRKFLTGVRFEGSRAMATDANCGAVLELGGVFPNATVPQDALAAVLKTAPTSLRLSVSEESASISTEATTWTTTLFTAAYPDVSRVIRPTSQYSMTFNSDELSDALARVRAVGPDVHNVNITCIGGIAEISAADATSGTDVIDEIEFVGDFDGSIRIDPSTIDNFINGAASETVTFEVEDNMKALCGHHGSFQQAVMPRHQ